MARFPEPIQNLIEEFNKLPGIGPKTSERFIFYLLKQPEKELDKLAERIKYLKEKITLCSICFVFTDKTPCVICSDARRDQKTICVVAESPDVLAIEKTGKYQGTYHVLEGVINQIEGIGPDQLKIKELVNRIKKDGIKEVILATNPDLEGESTALYLVRLLKPLKIKITRLGRGLPMGSNIEYADEVTLANALAGRGEIN